MRVTVNARTVEIPAGWVSYEQIAELAGHPGDTSLTMTWKYREGRAAVSGLLSPGDSVHVPEGAIFDASRTGSA